MSLVHEHDLVLADGSTLHVHDTRGGDVALVWHHGTPNIGSPPAPLLDRSAELGVRWISWDRPGYGTSTARPGRDVASAAGLTEQVLDALGVGSFVTMGHSGGGSHALACAALLPERARGVVTVSGLAPRDADGLDWYAGMADVGAGALRAAEQGREVRLAWEETQDQDADPGFVDSDLAAFEGPWGWFGSVVGPALAAGPGPAIDDDLAHLHPWGFDPADVRVPALVLHGTLDRVVPVQHGRWLASRIPGSELREQPGAGHISVLLGAQDALTWLVDG